MSNEMGDLLGAISNQMADAVERVGASMVQVRGRPRQAASVSVDLTAMGKIIGGGQPVGAVAGTPEAMAVFDASLGRPVVPHGVGVAR